MSDLQNQTPADTYKGLLQVGDYTDGITNNTGANALQVTDGAGVNTALALSTTRVGVGNNSPQAELDVSGGIEATTLTTSGAVTAGSVSTSGAVTGGSVSTGGAVTAGSIDVSGNVVADEYALDGTGSSTSAVAIHAPAPNELAIRTNSTEAMRIDSSGRVGIGTASPDTFAQLSLFETTYPSLYFDNNSTTGGGAIRFFKQGTLQGVVGSSGWILADTSNDISLKASTGLGLRFYTNGNNERMRIDSNGNVGIGTNDPLAKVSIVSVSGDTFQQIWDQFDGVVGGSGQVGAYTQYATKYHSATTPDYSYAIGVDMTTSTDGINPDFKIGYNTSNFATPATNTRLTIAASGNVLPGTDNAQDFGSSTKRWDDIYATNTTIQSSDRELKQDIEELTEAETRVARACKGLLRKYRWKDAVAEKDDEARIHFGIIAQDLEDAFTTEGLDAGRYGMFVKNTWWQADRVIPEVEAVDAVYDEDGNKVSSAVLGRPETIVTDIFNNSEDAPEGAIEVTQRGVRYSELLAFIIAAI